MADRGAFPPLPTVYREGEAPAEPGMAEASYGLGGSLALPRIVLKAESARRAVW
jgi:hypothetical protein